jgi:hypothetical protein
MPKCNICGAANAPLGYRHPGPWSKLPADKRGRLRCCTNPDCIAAAEARWLGATQPKSLAHSPSPPSEAPQRGKAAVHQPSLFDDP